MRDSAINPFLVTHASTAICSPREDTDELLQQALAACAQVSLYRRHQPTQPLLCGQLQRINGPVIEVATFGTSSAQVVPDLDPAFIARFFFHEHLYQFKTQLLPQEQGQGIGIQLAYPNVIERLERRRFPRRALRQRSCVHLDPVRKNGHRTTGSLLNVSPTGLACRVAADDAATLSPQTRLRATFALADTDHQYSLGGHVVNKLDAGTPGLCIVGIEFDNTDSATMSRMLTSIHRGQRT